MDFSIFLYPSYPLWIPVYSSTLYILDGLLYIPLSFISSMDSFIFLYPSYPRWIPLYSFILHMFDEFLYIHLSFISFMDSSIFLCPVYPRLIPPSSISSMVSSIDLYSLWFPIHVSLSSLSSMVSYTCISILSILDGFLYMYHCITILSILDGFLYMYHFPLYPRWFSIHSSILSILDVFLYNPLSFLFSMVYLD